MENISPFLQLEWTIFRNQFIIIFMVISVFLMDIHPHYPHTVPNCWIRSYYTFLTTPPYSRGNFQIHYVIY